MSGWNGQFNARISRLERFFSLNTSKGQFDPRIDRLERTVNLKECTGQFDDRIDRLERLLNEQSGEHSYTGDIVRFYTIKSVPLSFAEVSLSPIQSGSGDPSPTNIRPISGHTGAELNVAAEYDAEGKTTYSVTFTDQGTVYGGTFDFVTGVGKITHRMITFDGTQTIGKEPASWNPNANVFYYELGTDANKGNMPSTKIVPNIIGNMVLPVKYTDLKTTPDNWRIGFTSDGRYLEWTAPFSSVADMNSFLTSTPMQVVFELATPIEYTLTPQQIETLLGENNVWSDAGEITVKYNMQTKGSN